MELIYYIYVYVAILHVIAFLYFKKCCAKTPKVKVEASDGPVPQAEEQLEITGGQTTTKLQRFAQLPLREVDLEQDVPGIGPANYKLLKAKGIDSAVKLVGYFMSMDCNTEDMKEYLIDEINIQKRFVEDTDKRTGLLSALESKARQIC
eukprot:GCRY01001036.1.p2 GENE.GCRY01001036.1~~GCRY01001036.1.p2  ORF type:complete len:149 (+),score=20.42 GCRY01001036.1:63-509(+)